MAATSMKWNIHHVKSVGSTQQLLREKAVSGAGEGTVVYADKQTGGRGRQGRQWDSPVGNLYCSLLLKPQCSLQEAGLYAFIVAVALANTIEDIIDADGIQPKLKWPNDVLIEKRKCAGILLETETNSKNIVTDLFIGFGVNILSQHESDRIGLSDYVEGVSKETVLNKFLKNLGYFINIYNKNGFPLIASGWRSYAFGLGERGRARTASGEYHGVFKDLDDDGALLLLLDNGDIKRITAGDVYFER